MSRKKRQQEFEEYYDKLMSSELKGEIEFFLHPREELFRECQYNTRLVLDELIQLQLKFKDAINHLVTSAEKDRTELRSLRREFEAFKKDLTRISTDPQKEE